VTQNVDDLHRQAGHRDLAEIHGNARLARCIECLHREPLAGLALDSLPPLCPRCGGIVKSDTVSFGEPIPPDVLARCREQAGLADCILVVGTSATVYPAAGLAVEVLERGGALIEVNPEETDLTAGATVHLPGAAAHVLPRLVDAVRATPARDRSRS
jgi:NAD-dependent deacetylase